MARWRKRAELKESPAHVDGKGFKANAEAPASGKEVRPSDCKVETGWDGREAIDGNWRNTTAPQMGQALQVSACTAKF
jgi:hypothetical protein